MRNDKNIDTRDTKIEKISQRLRNGLLGYFEYIQRSYTGNGDFMHKEKNRIEQILNHGEEILKKQPKLSRSRIRMFWISWMMAVMR